MKRLIKLPCSVGDKVYWFWCDSEGNPDSGLEEGIIKFFYINEEGLGIAIDYHDGFIGNYVKDGELTDNGCRRIFLTRESAEKYLQHINTGQ